MLKIWGRPNSIHTQRVLWTCVEANVTYELIPASATMGPDGHISGGGAPYGVVDTPQYLAMNPNGTVPTIDDDGVVLWESNVIARYLAQRYSPDALFGDCPKTLALASQWMDWTNTRLEPALHVLVMEKVRLTADERDPANVERVRRDALPSLEILDRHLAERPYVAGEAFSVGDIPPGATVYRWLLLDLDGPPLVHLRAWQARLAERDGFRRHVAPRENHLQ